LGKASQIFYYLNYAIFGLTSDLTNDLTSDLTRLTTLTFVLVSLFI
jgi:hypothetical protein